MTPPGSRISDARNPSVISWLRLSGIANHSVLKRRKTTSQKKYLFLLRIPNYTEAHGARSGIWSVIAPDTNRAVDGYRSPRAATEDAGREIRSTRWICFASC